MTQELVMVISPPTHYTSTPYGVDLQTGNCPVLEKKDPAPGSLSCQLLLVHSEGRP